MLASETYNGQISQTKYYFGSYEKTIEGKTVTEYCWLPGGALYKTTNGTGELLFTYTDHLGSITHITDNDGNLLAEQSFGAWGRIRNPETWQILSPDAVRLLSFVEVNGRGYTAHEMLPTFALINMNGRLYDPVLGRMLSPDNYIQLPDYTQNFNRYSYVLNNPLKYTDPSGQWINLAIGATIGGIKGMMIAHQKGYGLGDWQFYAYSIAGSTIGAGLAFGSYGLSMAGASPTLIGAAAGAGGGASYTALAGGSGKQIAWNGFVGGASGFVGGAAGSAVGGVPGAFIGGVASYSTSYGLNYVNAKAQGQEPAQYNLGEAMLVGGTSAAMYLGMSYYNWRFVMNKQWERHDLKFKSYLTISGDFQRSRFWHKEYGGVLLPDGTITRSSANMRHNYAVQVDVPDNAVAIWHTHWDKSGNIVFVNPDGDIINSSSSYTDILSSQQMETTHFNGPDDRAAANLLGKPSFVVNRRGYSYYDLSNNNMAYNNSFRWAIFFGW